jgi:hypothetical protein
MIRIVPAEIVKERTKTMGKISTSDLFVLLTSSGRRLHLEDVKESRLLC